MLLPAAAVHRFSEADVPYAHKVFVLLPDAPADSEGAARPRGGGAPAAGGARG